jgi:hypothetical protein
MIRIEMKFINTYSWLVNFMLSFSGPKVFFFKLTWQRSRNNVHTCWTRPNKNGPNLIEFHLKKLQLGPTKSFLDYTNNASIQEKFWAQPNCKQAKLVLWPIQFITIGMPHQIMSSVAKLQEWSNDALYWWFCMCH